MNGENSRIDDLLEIMRENDLEALSVRGDGFAYELVASTPAAAGVHEIHAALPETAPAGEQAGANVVKITAPIIGVFYRSPSPGTGPFVEVGDHVAVGQVLCILEAMKMMNEIVSDHAGVVSRILPENSQLVSLGEEMFWIEQ